MILDVQQIDMLSDMKNKKEIMNKEFKEHNFQQVVEFKWIQKNIMRVWFFMLKEFNLI